MDRLEAIKATKNGAIAACLSGALTLAVFLTAIFTNAKGEIGLWNDPIIILDVLLIFACAYGIYKKSRFAAVLLFCYFVFGRIFISIETGKVSGLWIALAFLYFYGKAIQGAFVYHKIEKAENPNYKTTPKWIYFTGISAITIVAALMFIGLLMTTGTLTSTEVQTGSEVSQRDKDVLISNSIVSKDDHIEYFYSYGLTSILEGGSILTDDRVILYLPDENQKLEVYQLYFNDIASVELIEMGNFINDSIYKVSSHKPDAWLQLALSAENRGDVKFIESLRSKIATPLTPRDIANTAKAAFVTVTGYYNGDPYTTGSGFVIHPNGVVVTNLHVLRGADTVELTLSNGEVHSRVFVLGVDTYNDLTLLQIQADSLPSLSLNIDRHLEVGDQVYVLGNPLGLDQTFSDGILSAKRIVEETELYQISAPISEGSSGGPVLDSYGAAIGVATATMQEGQNLNLVVPAHYVRDLMETDVTPELFTEIYTRIEFEERETVAMRAEESKRLLNLFIDPAQTDFLNLDPWVKQTLVRGVNTKFLLEENGWTRAAESLGVELLEQGEVVQANVTLEAGYYAAAGLCDDDCLDLDIGVAIPDQESLLDNEHDANPFVTFELVRPSEITIYTRMQRCEADSCFYMVNIYGK